ncbi:YhcN/YlaJ family sporulation lipoprotein [Bacillus sp. Marseille-P3661]|uniref:YhcN/YlaJ family sporulation lipoprotein n=1 Tax=Bacillus sp. Marseille-P3661 TaxID=1936234 RepID=UPI000C847595|nr:YhcN/YlaJ family sporulation lipoprotein [Bacillus sp. Marseille-P3661]
MTICRVLILFITIISTFWLAGCNYFNGNAQPEPMVFEEPVKISTSQQEKYEQIDVDKVLNSKKEIKDIRSVTHKDDVVVALELVHWYTFQSKKLADRFKKDLEKEWPDKKFEVTTDHKIFIELEKLQNEINNDDLSKKEIGKKLDKINKLSKEQT